MSRPSHKSQPRRNPSLDTRGLPRPSSKKSTLGQRAKISFLIQGFHGNAVSEERLFYASAVALSVAMRFLQQQGIEYPQEVAFVASEADRFARGQPIDALSTSVTRDILQLHRYEAERSAADRQARLNFAMHGTPNPGYPDRQREAWWRKNHKETLPLPDLAREWWIAMAQEKLLRAAWIVSEQLIAVQSTYSPTHLRGALSEALNKLPSALFFAGAREGYTPYPDVVLRDEYLVGDSMSNEKDGKGGLRGTMANEIVGHWIGEALETP